MVEKFEQVQSTEQIQQKSDIQQVYKKQMLDEAVVSEHAQQQLEAENDLIVNIGFETYFANCEYTVKNGDGFLKILQGLLGYGVTKNIKGEDLVSLANELDTFFIKHTGFKIQPLDKVTLHNGTLKITNKEGKVKFQKPLSIPPSNIQIVDRDDFYKNKYRYIAKEMPMAQESLKINKDLPLNRHMATSMKSKTTYEEISARIDGVLTVVGVVSGGVIIIFGAPAIGAAIGVSAAALGTTLLIASIGKCLADGYHEYNKTGDISKGDMARLGVNIGASMLDRYTMGSGSRGIRALGTVLDELSDPIGIQTKKAID